MGFYKNEIIKNWNEDDVMCSKYDLLMGFN